MLLRYLISLQSFKSSLLDKGRVVLTNSSRRNVSSNLKTSLYDFHVANEAKMIGFAGYDMPVQYGKVGIAASHKHVRSNCGLFDVSHMLQVKIHGKDREKYVESITVADVENLVPNTGTLSLFTNDQGGIIDDLICSKVDSGSQGYLYIVSNAGCRDKDLENMKKRLDSFKGDAQIEVLGDQSLVALQGPKAASVLQKLVSIDLSKVYFMNTLETDINGVTCRISRCGYTGEDGFEISVPNSKVTELCECLMSDSDVQLSGLGARDSLRLEAGLCLYGNDIDETTLPIEATLAWTISKRRRANADFPGAQFILKQLKEKPSRKRIGLVSHGAPPRAHCKVLDSDGLLLGEITSGCPSPSLSCNVSMGYLSSKATKPGTKVQVQVRNKTVEAEVTKMPFVKSNYYYNST